MVLVLFAGLLVVLLGLAALLVDLGQQRASRRDAQSIADMAALGGGKHLSLGNPGQACLDIITYFDANATSLPAAISGSSFCSQPAPINVSATTCSGGSGQAKPTASSGRYTIQLLYPVYDTDISDPNFTGPGTNDGTACDRMALKVTETKPTYFSRIFGATTTSTTRTAVVKKTSRGKTIPSLWLLDPTGCVSLAASGGAQLSVGDVTNPANPIPGSRHHRLGRVVMHGKPDDDLLHRLGHQHQRGSGHRPESRSDLALRPSAPGHQLQRVRLLLERREQRPDLTPAVAGRRPCYPQPRRLAIQLQEPSRFADVRLPLVPRDHDSRL